MELPTQRYRVTRADLIRYAGASGDFNPIHWSESFAAKVGLPGVIAHGMLTMALVGRAVTTWAGRPDAIVEYGVRFTRPVEVPDTEDGTEIEVTAVAKDTDDPGLVRLDLTATCAGVKVLAQAKAVIKRP
ncbi:MaoC family dehydratase [Catenuloplanes atrovinosus]|uniref:Acyl dehydratase n=1 Tax=Catenuloplanes atrovinosus TaxID=137266 RepID=A0AAE4CCR1_9ACTN|nr:MaoC family dehydratase [Catenuloplanes atrovinosus]MDR7279492.1 acyl dehydratase [Catenuloplanes atrovinosus]